LCLARGPISRHTGRKDLATGTPIGSAPGIHITDEEEEDNKPDTSFWTEADATAALDHEHGSWNSAVKQLGDTYRHVRECQPTITRVVMTFE
jgi:hypothetical protein